MSPDPRSVLRPAAPPGLQQPSSTVPASRRHRLRSVLGQLLFHTVVEPVSTGRLRSAGWPPGLRAIVGAAITLAVLTVASLVAAPVLRSVLPLGASDFGTALPTAVIPLALAVPMFALTLFQTGALHSPRWVRAAALVTTLATYGALGSNTAFGGRVWESFALISGCWLALFVLQLLRARRPFAWWEFLIPLAANYLVLFVSLAPILRTDNFGDVSQLVANAESTVVWVGALAVPVAIAAGFAIAQLASSTVVWSVDLTRRNVGPRVLTVLLLLVAGWRLVVETRTLITEQGRWDELGAAAALLTACVVVWLVLDKLADRAERRAAPTTTDQLPVAESGSTRGRRRRRVRERGTPRDTGIFHLGEDVAAVCLPIGVLFAVGGLIAFLAAPGLYAYALVISQGGAAYAQPMALLYAAPGLLGRLLATTPALVAIGLGIVVAGGWLAHRGRRGVAEVVGLIGVLRIATQLFHPELVLTMVPTLATGVLTVLLVVWLARRRLDGARTEALLVGYLIAAAFGSRDLFADPFDLVLGGSAALLFGLVWEFLTGSADANEDSPTFPRPGRVLLLIANSVIGLALLAWIAWTRNSTSVVDLTVQQRTGDMVLGGALLIGILCAVVVSALRGRDIGTPDTR